MAGRRRGAAGRRPGSIARNGAPAAAIGAKRAARERIQCRPGVRLPPFRRAP